MLLASFTTVVVVITIYFLSSSSFGLKISVPHLSVIARKPQWGSLVNFFLKLMFQYSVLVLKPTIDLIFLVTHPLILHFILFTDSVTSDPIWLTSKHSYCTYMYLQNALFQYFSVQFGHRDQSDISLCLEMSSALFSVRIYHSSACCNGFSIQYCSWHYLGYNMFHSCSLRHTMIYIMNLKTTYAENSASGICHFNSIAYSLFLFTKVL